jgi:outer membrane protein assembly factor BamB
LEWETTIVPTNDYRVWYYPYFFSGTPRAIVLDEEGRAFTAGTSKTAPTTGATDIFVLAQEDGATAWFADGLTFLEESLAGMVLTRSGDVITAVNQRFSGNLVSYYFRRHTREGALVWRANGNSNVGYVSLAGLVLDSQENLITAGRQQTFGPVYDEGYFVEKRNAAGGVVWRVFVSQHGVTHPNALAVDRNDNVYVNYHTDSGHSWNTAKFNPAGELQWTATKTNVLRYLGLDGLTVDEDENVYVSASVIAASGDGDIETRMLNRDGQAEWEAFYDAGADERLVKLVADDKGLYMTFQSSVAGYAPPQAITSFLVRYPAESRKGN